MSKSLSNLTASKRLVHKKTRNGCSTCKARHLRCGEEHPICKKCMIRGYDCHYEGSEDLNLSTATAMVHLLQVIPGAAVDPFNSSPVEMIHRSHEAQYELIHRRMHVFMSAPFTDKHNSQTPSGMGIFQSDPNWFRVGLCISASCFSLLSPHSPTGFESTFWHHRLKLLQWLKGQVGVNNSLSFISLIYCLSLSDVSVGDDQAAESHIRGALSIMASRPDASQFYTCMMTRQALASTCFVCLSKGGAAGFAGQTNARWTSVSSSIWTGAMFIYGHMVVDYFLEVMNSGDTCPCKRRDKVALKWLRETVRNAGTDGGPTEYPQEWSWKIAICFYALIVGGLGWKADKCAGLREGSEPRRLKELDSWFRGIIAEWVSSAQPMTVIPSIAGRFRDKIEWLETEDGLELVEEIIKESQDTPCCTL